jgi:GDP-4-dehydro-6-deoxy-D-mannose reductase
MIQADLLDKSSIKKALTIARPNIVINCAGIVDNSDASLNNIAFTTNLLESINESELKLDSIIILGSAAEYGLVDPKNVPVREDAPLNANAGYGLSKLKESQFALEYSKAKNLPVTVARIFNPIGSGMHHRFLVPKIIAQVNEIISGGKPSIEVSRLDSKRDYINVKDVAGAIAILAERHPRDKIYNIGSGKATSNGKLIEIILTNFKLPNPPQIIETSGESEQLVAIQADISRFANEFGWEPKFSIEDTIKEIIDDTTE